VHVVSDILGFINARNSEDRAGALAASPGPWTVDGCQIESVVFSQGGIRAQMAIYDEGGHSEDDARHIARWHPTAVLAHCDAIDLLIGPHRIGDGWAPGEPTVVCARCQTGDDDVRELWPCEVARSVAGFWAWHPDYQAVWVL
jgi:Family of unknown function (DUF6221)